MRIGARGVPWTSWSQSSPQELPPQWMLGIKKSCKGQWTTPPFDPRFPNQNQTRNCYQNFLGEPSRAG